MIRYGTIALLFLSVFLMIKGISETWKNRTLLKTEVGGKSIPTGEEIKSDIVFNPPVSPDLPDFKDGYLFNEKRALEEEKGPEPEPEEENLAGNDLGIETNINETTFSGAIIADTFKKAIITYTASPSQAQTATAKKTTARTSRRRPAPKASRSTLETTQLMEGDLISGYKVASIEQDKIVFTKDGETIEKYLYDPDKQRAAPVARAKPATAVPLPRPGGRTTGAPRVVSPPVAPAGHAGTTTEPAQPEKKTITARRPSTARRLVVSRKPPPKPDTSRVSRRSRASAAAPSTPPPGMPGVPGGPPIMSK